MTCAPVRALSLATLLVYLAASAPQLSYDEDFAVTATYLDISSNCGPPNYNPTFLVNWSCGPSCGSAGPVTDVTLFEDSGKGVYGYVGTFQDHCLLVFRGTSTTAGWFTDADFALTDFKPAGGDCDGCQVHKAIYEGYQNVVADVRAGLEGLKCTELTITGHSMGAMLATMAVYDLGSTYTIKRMYNFGSGRVGNPTFAAKYAAKYPQTFRMTHHKDPVPQVAPPSSGYEHVPNEIFYNNDTAAGYKVCKGGEDPTCSAQFGGSFLKAFGDYLCCKQDHGQYMMNTVKLVGDAASCQHVSMTRAAQLAYITTAAYCEKDSVEHWDCGAPCDKVKGGVQDVQVFEVPFHHAIPISADNRLNIGTVKGFVGKWGDRCLLSISDLFDPQTGLAVLEHSSELSNFDACDGCKVHSVALNAYTALRQTLLTLLQKIGCTRDAEETSGRRLIATGHGLGASVAVLAAVELQHGTGHNKGTFGVEGTFNFGLPRLGNHAFLQHFQAVLGQDVFRVTHHKDPFLEFPSAKDGFVHLPQELFFEGDTKGDSSYVRCPYDGEDQLCSQKHTGEPLGSISDHMNYLRPLVEVEMSEKSCKRSAVVV